MGFKSLDAELLGVAIRLARAMPLLNSYNSHKRRRVLPRSPVRYDPSVKNRNLVILYESGREVLSS